MRPRFPTGAYPGLPGDADLRGEPGGRRDAAATEAARQGRDEQRAVDGAPAGGVVEAGHCRIEAVGARVSHIVEHFRARSATTEPVEGGRDESHRPQAVEGALLVDQGQERRPQRRRAARATNTVEDLAL